jgi:hypothetical protein
MHIEEADFLSSSNEEDGQRRIVWTQHAPYFESREQRRQGNTGHQDHFFSEERHDQRFPDFNMQRVHHAAHQPGRNFFQDDRLPKGEHLVEDPVAIITRLVKVDFPKFDGIDPSGWIYKAYKFFYYHRTPYNMRLILASIHMEGKALVWYQDMEMSSYLPNWTILAQALMQRFGPSAYDDPMESLA